MPGNWHVRFGGAASGNGLEKPRTAPEADSYQTEGWNLTHPQPGVLTWTTPTGRAHTVHPDPDPT